MKNIKNDNEKFLEDDLENLRLLYKKNGFYDTIQDIITCMRMTADVVPFERRIYDLKKAEILLSLERICLEEEQFLKRRGR